MGWTFLKPALGLAGFMVLGALAAFLTVGVLIPWIQAGGPGHQGAPPMATASSPSPRICGSALVVSPPVTTPSASATSSSTPTMAWVNAPLGVHLRAAPSLQAAVVTTLSQGNAVAVDSAATDAAGATWYHARVGANLGWVRSDFMVGYAVVPAGDTQGWSGLVPDGLGVHVIDSGDSDIVPGTAAPLPFARVQSSSTGTPGLTLPSVIHASDNPVPVRTSTVQVWNYTAQEQVVRVALDPCQVQVNGRADAGWPYQTSVVVHAGSRTYRFTLWSTTADDVRVANFLSSVALH